MTLSLHSLLLILLPLSTPHYAFHVIHTSHLAPHALTQLRHSVYREKFVKFKVSSFCDLAKFAKFAIHECSPLKGTRLILNEIATFSSAQFSRYRVVQCSHTSDTPHPLNLTPHFSHLPPPSPTPHTLSLG